MKLTSLIASSFVIALIALASLSILAVQVHAYTVSSNSNCTVASGVFWDSAKIIWQPCYDTGHLQKLDFATNPPTVVADYDLSVTVGTYNVIAAWGDSNNIYLIGRNTGQVFTFVKATQAISVLAGGIAAELLYPALLNGFLYVPYGNGVAKVSVSTGSKTLIATGQQMVQATNDGNLVFSTSTSGQVYEIDPTTNTATLRVSGLSTPYGIAVDASNLYVAQHGAGQAVKISRSTWSTVATSALPVGTTPYGIAIYGTNVLVDSDGPISTRNVYVLKISDMSTANTVTCPITEAGQCRPLFILQTDSSGNAYVGFQGSAGTVEIEHGDWVPSSSTTTTTTTTSTATTDASGCVIGTKCAGHWTPIVIPTIHVSSVLANVNETLYPTGTVSISGFEFFMAGPSSGDFLQMAQLVGCCAAIMSNLNPSNGTFATISVTARPYNTNNYPDAPTPAFVMNAPLTSTSETKFGWFCNNQNVVQYVWQCDGSALPVNYRTFSFTAPIHTIVQIQATGTASQGEVSVYNIFT